MTRTLYCLTRARVLLGSVFIIWLLIPFILALRCPEAWATIDVLTVAFVYFVPAAILFWSILPGYFDHSRLYALIRRSIPLHGIAIMVAAVVFLAFGSLRGLFLAVPDACIDLLILGFSPGRTDVHAIQFFRKSVLIIGGGLIATLLTWSFANIGFVAWRAEEIAGERPYCLHVSMKGTGAYRKAASLLDLSGLAMQAPYDHDLQFSYHSVIAVQTQNGIEWYNWSYRQMQFMRLTKEEFESALVGMRKPQCELKPHFIRSLPLFRP